MIIINGFYNEEFQLEKEFCLKKMHITVMKIHDSEDGRYITEKTLNTFWQKV